MLPEVFIMHTRALESGVHYRYPGTVHTVVYMHATRNDTCHTSAVVLLVQYTKYRYTVVP